MNVSDKSVMPAVIVLVALLGFFSWGSYILYKSFNPSEGIVESAKVLSLLDMFVIAAIGLVTGSTGYWLGKTHSDIEEKKMLLHSTPQPPDPPGA